MKKVTVLSAFSLLSLFTGADAEQRFGIDQYLALNSVAEISVSPDGLYVAYTVTSNDLKKDQTRDTVWMQPTDGGDPIQMTASGSDSSSPRWSPDGRYLAVLSDRKDEITQVWLLDRRGGDAQQLTKFKQGIDEFDWAPDSNSMLLVTEDPTPADLDEEERPNPRPYVVDRLQFKEDYVGYLDRHRSHIHIIDVSSGDTRQVTSGDFDDSEPAWSADSQRIVFVSNRTDKPDRNRNTDLWIVDVSKNGDEPLQLTSNETADASPSWSPDGQFVVYTSTVPGSLPIYAIPQLTTVHIATGLSVVAETLAETQVLSARYSPDGQTVLAITEYHGEQNLVRIDQTSGAVQSIVDGKDIVTEFDITPDGDLYALVSRPQLPDEIFDVGDVGITQISFVSQSVLGNITLASIEKHTLQSEDGTDIDTFVTFPPGYKKGKAYPGILMIHGGPQSQYDYGFDYEAQLLAAQGYVVVMPNPRGSYGYGQAFAEAIIRDWGGIDYVDVMAAMDFAIAEGWVDEDRMGVYGWSYGGMMVNHVITKTGRFKAAITVASATLYAANYGHDQYQRWWEEELGLPWLAENREKWDRISPFYKLDKVTTPTLIAGGEDDWNVPILNSEQLYIALKRQGVPTELIVYPGQGHLLDVPSYEKDLYERYFVWLKRYVNP
ncbi:MAG: S9 family peptidase [Proteobacteria bacterium]|nr:S9 family peptidase [Pseudomonadota bacterium]